MDSRVGEAGSLFPRIILALMGRTGEAEGRDAAEEVESRVHRVETSLLRDEAGEESEEDPLFGDMIAESTEDLRCTSILVADGFEGELATG